MGSKVIFLSLARQDFETIVQYYEGLNKTISKRYAQGIMEHTKQLVTFPDMGRPVPEFAETPHAICREIVFEIFRILYFCDNHTIFILRIIDSRRQLKLPDIDNFYSKNPMVH